MFSALFPLSLQVFPSLAHPANNFTRECKESYVDRSTAAVSLRSYSYFTFLDILVVSCFVDTTVHL